MTVGPRAHCRRWLLALLAGALFIVAFPGVGRAAPAIDPYPVYAAPTCLTPVEQAGVREFRDMIRSRVGGTNLGIHACSGYEHGEGRAWDWGMNAGDATDRAKVQLVLDWLLATDSDGNRHAMARRLGIGYVIWNRRIASFWSDRSDKGVWRDYTGSNPHTDHVHFSFGWPGALRETTWFSTSNRPGTWYPGGTAGDRVVLGANADGRLQVFGLSGGGEVRTAHQTSVNGPWTVVYGLGGQDLRGLALDRNVDGRLELFASGGDGQLYHAWQQNPNSAWSSFYPFGLSGLSGDLTVAANEDGRLQVFAVAGDSVRSVYQLGGGNWSGAHDFGAPPGGARGVAVARNTDGRLELFATAGNGRLYHIYQTAPNGSWVSWQELAATGLTGEVSAASNADGRIQVFATGTGGTVYSVYQLGAGGWSGRHTHNGTGLRGLSVTINPDGRLEMFATGGDGRLYHNYQTSPNGAWIDSWPALPGNATTLAGATTTGPNADGHIQTFAIATNDTIHTIRQTPDGWSAWSQL